MDTGISETDATEHWLLGLASRYRAPIEWLLPKINLEALNVGTLEGLTAERCGEVLIKLEDAGAIRVYEAGKVLTGETFASVVKGLLNGERRQVDFELSELGGRRWESVAHPDWSRFVQVFSVSPAEGESTMSGVVAGINWDVVIAYVGHHESLRDQQIIRESLKYAFHDHYNITYWKTLPFVHVFSFQCYFPGRYSVDCKPLWLRNWWATIQEC
jgi:hypothetical protein